MKYYTDTLTNDILVIIISKLNIKKFKGFTKFIALKDEIFRNVINYKYPDFWTLFNRSKFSIKSIREVYASTLKLSSGGTILLTNMQRCDVEYNIKDSIFKDTRQVIQLEKSNIVRLLSKFVIVKQFPNFYSKIGQLGLDAIYSNSDKYFNVVLSIIKIMTGYQSSIHITMLKDYLFTGKMNRTINYLDVDIYGDIVGLEIFYECWAPLFLLDPEVEVLDDSIMIKGIVKFSTKDDPIFKVLATEYRVELEAAILSNLLDEEMLDDMW